MRLHGRTFNGRWASVVVALLLIAAHGFLFRLFSNRKLPVAFASGVIIVVALKHFGLLGALYARFRRRLPR